MNLCQYFPTSRRTPFHNFVCKRGRFFISKFRFFFTLFKILQKHIQCHNTFLYLPSLQILHSEFEFRKQKEVICVMQSFYNKLFVYLSCSRRRIRRTKNAQSYVSLYIFGQNRHMGPTWVKCPKNGRKIKKNCPTN